MTPQEQEAALAAQIKKFDRFDLGLTVLTLVLILCVIGYSIHDAFNWYAEKGAQKDLSILPVIVLVEFLLISFPVIFFGQLMSRAIRRYIPRYIIDESDPTVVRLVGEVGLIEYGRAVQALLSKRKDYRLANNAYEQYGCTMAAVPATGAELEAQKELKKLGVFI